MPALPAITVEETIDDSVRVHDRAELGDNRGDTRPPRSSLGRTSPRPGDHGGRNRRQDVASSQRLRETVPSRTSH